jgi:hypothetical protein
MGGQPAAGTSPAPAVPQQRTSSETTTGTPSSKGERVGSAAGTYAGQKAVQGLGAGRSGYTSAGGWLIGAVAYALLVNFMRSGTSGMTGWLRAKFLNETGSGSSGSGSSGSATVTPSGQTVAPGSGVIAPGPFGEIITAPGHTAPASPLPAGQILT